jgi:hypothetical protein
MTEPRIAQNRPDPTPGDNHYRVRPEVFWIAGIIAALVAANLMIPRAQIVLPVFLAVIITAIIAFFMARRDYYHAVRKMAKLKDRTRLHVIDNRLVLENQKGRIVAYIVLSEDFKVSIPFRRNGKGVYRVEQSWRVLEFNSDIENAEQIVRNVLGCNEWPPDIKWHFGW